MESAMQHLEFCLSHEHFMGCLPSREIFWCPFVLPQSLEVSEHLEHSKKYLGSYYDDSRRLNERMEMSKCESVVCPFIHFLLSETPSFLGSE